MVLAQKKCGEGVSEVEVIAVCKCNDLVTEISIPISQHYRKVKRVEEVFLFILLTYIFTRADSASPMTLFYLEN